MKKILPLMTITLLTFANTVFAEATLTSLKVKEDIVYFATDEAKVVTPPSCMSAENSDKWTVSLNTSSGKAIYALLVTASADKRKISVESAEDCADMQGYERANTVSLGAQNIALVQGKQFYLYHGSGRKMGPIAAFLNPPYGKIAYLDSTNEQSLEVVIIPRISGISIWYAQRGCQGSPYVNYTGVHSVKGFNNDKFFQAVGMKRRKTVKSIFNGVSCTDRDNAGDMQEIDLTVNHPICGESPCFIKHE